MVKLHTDCDGITLKFRNGHVKVTNELKKDAKPVI